MATHDVTLNVPEPLYQYLKRRAEQAQRSLEAETLTVLAEAQGVEFIGTWEEVSARAEQFAGKEVRLIVLSSGEDNGDKKRPPNQAMLTALAEVEKLQTEMQPKEDSNTLKYLREARSGEMYGDDH